MRVNAHITLKEWEVTEAFARASGPGGQHVNKTETAVQLRFNVAASPSLDDRTKEKLARLAGRRMTKDGQLIIEAKRFRLRERNREDARNRLVVLIDRASKPDVKRKKTKVSRAEKQKRLLGKKRRGELKLNRRPPVIE